MSHARIGSGHARAHRLLALPSTPGTGPFAARKIAALRHGSNDRNANTAATRTALAQFDWILWGAYSTTGLEANIADIRSQAGTRTQIHSQYVLAQQVGGQISNVNSITRNGTTVTVNTADNYGASHAPDSNIAVGRTVTIINSPVAAYNADWTVASVSTTGFTFTASGAAATAANDSSGEAIACSTTTVVNPVIKKLNSEKGWWLWKVGTSGRRETGIPGFNALDMNLTTWAAADASGNRWPQWKAGYDSSSMFSQVAGLDFAYLDNYLDPRPDAINNTQYPGQQNYVDFQQSGTPQLITDPTVLSAHRTGCAAYATATRAQSVGRTKSPNIKCIGNHDSSLPGEYANSLEAVFLEGIVGRSWSKDQTSFATAMNYYQGVLGKLLSPAIVMFVALLTSKDQGINSTTHDYSRSRYAYCMAALQGGAGDTYVCLKADDDNDGDFMYDEFLANLGNPLDPNQSAAWSGTAWRRRFENGCVIVNSDHVNSVTVDLTGQGYKRLTGTVNPTFNNGAAVTGTLTIGPWDGIVLVKS